MSEKKNIKQESPAAEEQQVKESQEPSAAETQQVKEEKEAVIYLGPAIAGTVTPGTVYRNGLTPQLQKAVEECPGLRRLLAYVSRAGQMRKDLRDPQSAASICYGNAVEYAKKKGAEG